MVEQKSLRLSPPPDSNHHKRVILCGVAVLLIMVIAAGVGFNYGAIPVQNALSQIENLASSLKTQTTLLKPLLDSENTTNWKTYTNKHYHYAIHYPQNFSYKEGSATGLGLDYSALPSVVFAKKELFAQKVTYVYLAQTTSVFGITVDNQVKPGITLRDYLTLSAGAPATASSHLLSGYKNLQNITANGVDGISFVMPSFLNAKTPYPAEYHYMFTDGTNIFHVFGTDQKLLSQAVQSFKIVPQ